MVSGKEIFRKQSDRSAFLLPGSGFSLKCLSCFPRLARSPLRKLKFAFFQGICFVRLHFDKGAQGGEVGPHVHYSRPGQFRVTLVY